KSKSYEQDAKLQQFSLSLDQAAGSMPPGVFHDNLDGTGDKSVASETERANNHHNHLSRPSDEQSDSSSSCKSPPEKEEHSPAEANNSTTAVGKKVETS